MSNRKEYSVFHMHVIDGEVKKHTIQAIRDNGEYIFTRKTAIRVLNEIKFDLISHQNGQNIIIINEDENHFDYNIDGSTVMHRIEIKKAIRIE